MIAYEPWTSGQLDDLFVKAQQQRETYAEVYPFLKTLFSLKEQAVKTCRPEPWPLDTTTLDAQRSGGLPLIDRRAMSVDLPHAQALLENLFPLARETNPQMKQAAQRISDGLAAKTIDLSQSCRFLLSENAEGMQQQAAALDIRADLFAFFLYHSLWPSAAVHLRELTQHLPSEKNWTHGYCPFCGGVPALALLARNGRRYLVCSFCTHAWSSRRIFCPFCENETAAMLGYFFSEAEEEYRVHTCRKCQAYLKTVDIRQMTRPFYAPLEALITTHLDLQAQEQGFQNRTPAWFCL